MSYSLDSLQNDCYPGTSCLINKLNIRDDKQLAFVESRIVAMKTAELNAHPVKAPFDFAHYKGIHRFLFEDIYEWAGQIRTINMSKKGTRFTEASKIEEVAAGIFERLKRMNDFVGLPHDAFVGEIVDFYCATNMLHPFREGNGRTQRVFLRQLIQNAGYELSLSELDPDELMIATIHAANGVTDYLYRLFLNHIREQKHAEE